MDIEQIPTGLVGLGEDVYEAAEREVLEETGVRANFQGVVGIRHAHKVISHVVNKQQQQQ